MDIVAIFNLAEAGLWAAFATGIALLGGRARGMTLGLRIWLTLAFLAFGVSDVIESQTGAWWEPPSLFVFKALCFLSITAGAWRLWRNRRSVQGPAAD